MSDDAWLLLQGFPIKKTADRQKIMEYMILRKPFLLFPF